jgi:hypothetical protein
MAVRSTTCLFWGVGRSRFTHAHPSGMPNARRGERQRVRVRLPHVAGSGRVVSVREQCASAVKKGLAASYDELVGGKSNPTLK